MPQETPVPTTEDTLQPVPVVTPAGMSPAQAAVELERILATLKPEDRDVVLAIANTISHTVRLNGTLGLLGSLVGNAAIIQHLKGQVLPSDVGRLILAVQEGRS